MKQMERDMETVDSLNNLRIQDHRCMHILTRVFRYSCNNAVALIADNGKIGWARSLLIGCKIV